MSVSQKSDIGDELVAQGTHFSDETQDGDQSEREDEEAKALSETQLKKIKKSLMGEEQRKESSHENTDFEASETEEFDPNDFICPPRQSKNCTIQDNFLEFFHSFGYDCQKYFNLVLMDGKILIFASGNYIHFYNTENKELWFRRSALGGGFGHIVKNPNAEYSHLAVAENGDNPVIIIYLWPSFEIVCVLKGGAEKMYSCISYSADGELLCSQAGEPDYTLTIWKWKKSQIMLRQQSHIQSVFNINFSSYAPNHLTSCGASHIKFWKIANTFTGVKLIGQLGKFGKTEASDVIGCLALPNEKVVSGTSWGNILLWDEGLISVEVTQKQRKHCHSASITQFVYMDGELLTAGMDGFIKIWYMDTIELADPPEDDRFVEVDPQYEFEIKSGSEKASLMCIIKITDEPEDYFWFAQDANGGIWKLDINISATPQPPEKIFSCHAGPVADIATAPHGHFIATLGEDGRLYLFDYIMKKLITSMKFSSAGRTLLWLPLKVDKTGTVIIAGFADGMLRVFVATTGNEKNSIILIQVSKPHVQPITTMQLNAHGSILATGSEDATVFVYQILVKSIYPTLIPIGFVRVPSTVTYLDWNPNKLNRLLVCCKRGEFLEVDVPERPTFYTKTSYELKSSNMKINSFQSCKSKIRQDQKIKEIEERKAKKVEAKLKEMEKIKAANPGLEIDEETFLADSESEEELEPLYIPEVPNSILFAIYTPEQTLWLSMTGYDSGYIYEYKMDIENPVCCTMVEDADDTEIYTYIYDSNKEYLILAMQDGSVRVNRVNSENHRDLSDYWTLNMHDNSNGNINRMCFSYDEKYFFTCGNDSNIFAYKISITPKDYTPAEKKVFTPSELPQPIDDVHGLSILSLEQSKLKEESNRKLELVNRQKYEVIAIIQSLIPEYQLILERNQLLPERQQFSSKELSIDERITTDLNDLVKREDNIHERKLAFLVDKSTVALQKVHNYFISSLSSMKTFVKCIRTNFQVGTFRERKISQDFLNIQKLVQDKMEEALTKGRQKEARIKREQGPALEERKSAVYGDFVKNLPVHTTAYKKNKKLQHMIKMYKQRKMMQFKRKAEWQVVLKARPNPDKNHPDDEIILLEAEKTIGDFKLKTSPEYKIQQVFSSTTVQKYDELLKLHELIYSIKRDFDESAIKARDKKMELMEQFRTFQVQLNCIHDHLLEKQKQFLPSLPPVDTFLEYPEKYVQLLNEDNVQPLYKKEESGEEILKDPSDVNLRDYISDMLLWGRPDSILEREIDGISGDFFISVPHGIIPQLEALKVHESEDTQWEKEMRCININRILFEQDMILYEMDSSTAFCDKHIRELAARKIHLDLDTRLLEINQLILHQELIILKQFESMENELSEKVLDTLKQWKEIEAKIAVIEDQIEEKQKAVAALVDKQNDLTEIFKDSIRASKFVKFLAKIYKKKYKPYKEVDPEDKYEALKCSKSTTAMYSVIKRNSAATGISSRSVSGALQKQTQALSSGSVLGTPGKKRSNRTPTSSSSSSSTESSTESDESASSAESEEADLMKLDESFCPEGCEKELYDLAFTLREQRYALQQEEAEEKKCLDTLKKGLLDLEKKMKVADTCLQKDEQELENYQREKQKNLNQVAGLVVLKLNQMQHYNKDKNTFDDLNDSLIVTNKTLNTLLARVGELKKETDIHLEKHRKNQLHLHRMMVDCTYMHKVIRTQKVKITETLLRKFGSEVDIDELEEAILKQLLAELKSPMAEVIQENEMEIYKLEEQFKKQQTEFARAIQEETEKLHLLAILEEEKGRLENILRLQNLKMETTDFEREDEYLCDIGKLTQIRKVQAEQIAAIKNEIKVLSWKTLPLPPIKEVQTSHIPDAQQTFVLPYDADKGKELKSLAESDPTGVRGILNEIICSIPENLEQPLADMLDAGGVKRLLSEITTTLHSKESSSEDIDTLKQVTNDVLGRIDGSTADLDTTILVKNIVYDILDKVISVEECSSAQQVALDVVKGVIKSLEHVHTYTVRDVLDDIISKIVIKKDSAEEIIQKTLADIVSSLRSQAAIDIADVVREIVDWVIQNQMLQQQQSKMKAEEALFNITQKLEAAASIEQSHSIRKIILRIISDMKLKMPNITSDEKSLKDMIDILIDETLCEAAVAEDISHIQVIISNIIMSSLGEMHHPSTQAIPEPDFSDDEDTAQSDTQHN